MASSVARPEDFEEVALSIDHLLAEHAGWDRTLLRDTDDYSLITKTKALYGFAIKHYHESGNDLMLKAIAAFEAAEHEE